MNNGQFLDAISKGAKAYAPQAQASLIRNRHMNDLRADHALDQRVIDAVLIDFINYLGVQCGVDYAMYTSDLPSPLLVQVANTADKDETSK